MEVKAYLLDVSRFQQDSPEEDPRFRQLCESLSETRQKKIEKFRYGKGKALSLGAGLLLDYGLSWYGLRERDVAMAYGEDEKPYLRDFPEIHFNLSHSGTMALAVFANREVGCDIEKIAVPDMRMVRRFFAPGEARELEEILEEGKRTECFYRLWTLKESFLKVTGKGIRMPLNEFCIHLDLPVQAEKDGKILAYSFREFSFPGYRGSYCVEGTETLKEEEPKILSWEQIGNRLGDLSEYL